MINYAIIMYVHVSPLIFGISKNLIQESMPMVASHVGVLQ